MGRSGVAVIRISGQDALTALPFFGFHKNPEPRKAIYHHFMIPSQRVNASTSHLDSGLILYFPAPQSFTGEDCLEFQIHGSIAVIKTFLKHLSALPHFRMAEPGEFARRAFDNGKMDLTAAEGLADLIEAETEWQRAQANYAAGGYVRQFYDRLRDEVLTALALLEAYIDFPDEDIPEATFAEADKNIKQVQQLITQTLSQTLSAEKIREGFTIVILGAPNAGKSSLLNALSQKEAAIVSHQAGTTRDIIEVHLELDGIPVTLVDTAGIRETIDAIESEGIRRALDRAANADIQLVLSDASAPEAPMIELPPHSVTLFVKSKADLAPSPAPSSKELQVSVKDEESLIKLLENIKTALHSLIGGNAQHYFIRNRHRQHLQEATTQLEQYTLESDLILKCERLRLAIVEIGAITGVISVDEVLGKIFSTFCIGK
jgi:tRNA modification GTPase